MKFDKSPSSREAAVILRELTKRPPRMAARRIDKPLVLYGASKLGRMACELLDFIGEKPAFVVDAQAQRYRDDPFWAGRNLVAPDELPANVRSTHLLAVSIATLPYVDLAATLAAGGWRDIVPFYDVAEAYRDVYPLSNGWIWADIKDQDIERIESVLSLWADDISRAHHLQFLAWHRLREDWVFGDAPVDADNRYFIPEVTAVLGGNEFFVDVGAHRGESSEVFRQVVDSRFSGILMFEPDRLNAAAAQAALSRLPLALREKHTLLRNALSRSSGLQNFFAGLGYASQLTGMGGELVEVRSLDDFSASPTFIKLHLEGHELEALRGSEATLRRCRPIVATTSYHSDAGLWALPSWLMRNLENYKQYMRLHSWCGTGSVIYCVPVERQHAP